MILIKNMNKKFNEKSIFEDFNLEINSGEFVGIIGKSGKGKTTLLNIIGTLEEADSGIVKVMGKDIHKKRIKRYLLRHHLGFIFQNYALIDNASVNDNLELALKHKKISKKEKMESITLVLEEVGLNNYSKEKVHTLSGGEQQRIAIARLLLKDPDIILADEPTGSLDNENRDIIVSLFKNLYKQGKTIIMVTHDKDLAHHFSKVIQL
ncbi:putative bacteriocin export ABC transporter [Virgibacillus sp. AGTR]|uniref:putative bacteriocin export ABC transporter n=1 Tax=Virgibacillus sp. AGTR TaxID=2812055 RepID=UPI001D162D9B|nr:putative bacteriocin export ABC transporter [Virgibacillus sp. AGTR]MCC2248888.1 putative bacteriocin export ABC transporter [Virgibacillus sp. AGTR]